jgi:hypothetical protein
MADTTHIFTPKDNSLFERVSAYQTVFKSYLNAEASLKFADDENWSDTLGEREEIEQAYKISIDSLKMATEQISADEMKQTKEQGLIDQGELLEFVQNKRQQEIKNTRNKNSSFNLGSQLKSKNI